MTTETKGVHVSKRKKKAAFLLQDCLSLSKRSRPYGRTVYLSAHTFFFFSGGFRFFFFLHDHPSVPRRSLMTSGSVMVREQLMRQLRDRDMDRRIARTAHMPIPRSVKVAGRPTDSEYVVLPPVNLALVSYLFAGLPLCNAGSTMRHAVYSVSPC